MSACGLAPVNLLSNLCALRVHVCAGGGADGSPLVRHCINCFKAVEGAVAAEDAVLQGALDLFCSLECERSWSIKSSSGG